MNKKTPKTTNSVGYGHQQRNVTGTDLGIARSPGVAMERTKPIKASSGHTSCLCHQKLYLISSCSDIQSRHFV